MRNEISLKNETDQKFQQFLHWEATTRDALDVKLAYIDLAEDLAAGAVLSEIVSWYLPNKAGGSNLRVERNGFLWNAVPRSKWWDRCRLSPEQADYALRKLIKKGLIEKAVFMFGGVPTVHVRLCIDHFLAQLTALIETPSDNPHERPKTQGALIDWQTQAPQAYREPTRRDECREWLEDLLRANPDGVKVKEVLTAGREQGFSQDMIYRTRRELRGRIINTSGWKSPDNCWKWNDALKTEDTEHLEH